MEQSSKNQQPQTAIHKNQHFQGQRQDNEDEEAKIIQLQLLLVAKTIHFTNSSSVSESPTSVLPSPKRQTILQHRKLYGRNRRSCGKSVEELEFEELEGFRDLGFVFSEEDRKDSSLVQIVPGLKRLAKNSKGGDEGVERLNDHRPYLSEAWDAMEKKEGILKRTVLINRSIQEMGNDQNETLVKGLIKSWAHSVASAVR